jgi:hypothetical protein
MKHLTTLPLTLALLLSFGLGWPQLSLAKAKKQEPVQCEVNGTMAACPDSSSTTPKSSQPASFKAQSEDSIEAPVKKKKSKKSDGKKKNKRNKAAEE